MQNVIDRKHLDDPIPKRYLYWVQDAVTNQFGSTLLDNRPILPELWRVMKNTLQLVLIAQILVIFFAVLIGVYSAIRQYSGFDYTMTTVQLPRPRDARVLAGADGPGRRGPDLRAYGAPLLPDREPELGRPRHRDSTSGSTGRTIWRCPSSC